MQRAGRAGRALSSQPGPSRRSSANPIAHARQMHTSGSISGSRLPKHDSWPAATAAHWQGAPSGQSARRPDQEDAKKERRGQIRHRQHHRIAGGSSCEDGAGRQPQAERRTSNGLQISKRPLAAAPLRHGSKAQRRWVYDQRCAGRLRVAAAVDVRAERPPPRPSAVLPAA